MQCKRHGVYRVPVQWFAPPATATGDTTALRHLITASTRSQQSPTTSPQLSRSRLRTHLQLKRRRKLQIRREYRQKQTQTQRRAYTARSWTARLPRQATGCTCPALHARSTHYHLRCAIFVHNHNRPRNWIRMMQNTTAEFSWNGFTLYNRDLRSFKIRFEFESAVRFHSKVINRLENFRIKSAVSAPLFVVSLVKWLKPLTALSGTVNRLASSMSDHTPRVTFITK